MMLCTKRGNGVENVNSKLNSKRRQRDRRRAMSYRWLFMVAFAVLPSAAWALVTGELADRVADVLAVVVIIFVPVAGIYLFWKVHVLPEKIAEKRHHPQKDAIRVLCLLSLVFGGLLWPIAWLWAYTKPTLHKLAYGTDKYEEPSAAGQETIGATDIPLEDRFAALRREIDQLPDQGAPAEDIAVLRRDVARLEKKLVPPPQREAH